MTRIISVLFLAICSVAIVVSDACADSPKKATIPLVLFGAGAVDGPNFYPSGWMGNAAAIKLDPKSTDNPHSGATCLKFDYTAGDNWAGVVWQNPDNNWGDKAGGFDLTGAKRLTFWARGASGGEVVSFSFGLIGKDKPNYDTAKGSLEKVVLTKDWTQYCIDLANKDLSHIVSGFCWVVAGSGAPITFYLADCRYE